MTTQSAERSPIDRNRSLEVIAIAAGIVLGVALQAVYRRLMWLASGGPQRWLTRPKTCLGTRPNQEIH